MLHKSALCKRQVHVNFKEQDNIMQISKSRTARKGLTFASYVFPLKMISGAMKIGVPTPLLAEEFISCLE